MLQDSKTHDKTNLSIMTAVILTNLVRRWPQISQSLSLPSFHGETLVNLLRLLAMFFKQGETSILPQVILENVAQGVIWK